MLFMLVENGRLQDAEPAIEEHGAKLYGMEETERTQRSG